LIQLRDYRVEMAAIERLRRDSRGVGSSLWNSVTGQKLGKLVGIQSLYELRKLQRNPR
jgi:hypothetical protein